MPPFRDPEGSWNSWEGSRLCSLDSDLLPLILIKYKNLVRINQRSTYIPKKQENVRPAPFLLCGGLRRERRRKQREGTSGWRPSEEVTGLPPAGQPLLPGAEAEGKAAGTAAGFQMMPRVTAWL